MTFFASGPPVRAWLTFAFPGLRSLDTQKGGEGL